MNKPVIEVLPLDEAIAGVGRCVADLLYYANTARSVDEAMDLFERASILTGLMCSVQNAALNRADTVIE